MTIEGYGGGGGEVCAASAALRLIAAVSCCSREARAPGAPRVRRARAGRGAREPRACSLQALAERDPELHEHTVDVAVLARRRRRAARLRRPHARGDRPRRRAPRRRHERDLNYDELYAKQAPSTDEERNLVREHPRVGERVLLADVPWPYEIVPLVRHHPRALGRGRLPGRPPRRADPVRRTHRRGLRRLQRDAPAAPLRRGAQRRARRRAELRRCAGTQFDPRVVAVFCAL